MAHGIGALANLKAANDVYFNLARKGVLLKVQQGRFDVWPIFNIDSLLRESSLLGGTHFPCTSTLKGWTVSVGCLSGELPAVERALLARDAAFYPWCAEVASIAGIERY
jgi:hypothetical protein